jgi:hypothetical protein
MQDQNDELERMLRRYQPAGPSGALRARVLAAAEPAPAGATWPIWVYRLALAAMVLLAIGLDYAAERINHATAANIGIGPVIWTADAEQAAQLIGGGEAGRQYIAVCLMASTGGGEPQDNSLLKGAIQ